MGRAASVAYTEVIKLLLEADAVMPLVSGILPSEAATRVVSPKPFVMCWAAFFILLRIFLMASEVSPKVFLRGAVAAMRPDIAVIKPFHVFDMATEKQVMAVLVPLDELKFNRVPISVGESAFAAPR